MSITLPKLSGSALIALMFGPCTATQLLAQDVISPAMVNIPSGTFTMGNHVGNAKAKPAHPVSLPAFQVSKYPITVKEFRKFAEDTGFNPSPSCDDHISASWFSSPDDASGSATWDNHRFLDSEYQPVTCISWLEANEYAQWLSQKTGRAYRLPTEQEFEYALKAGTTSRYFWGDDDDLSQACRYGNFADKSGEHLPNIEYGASYVGFLDITHCDDGEAYNSIVGLYRPNPFGLYDMTGNVAQYTSTCYYDGYQSRTAKEMDNTQCEYVAHRGGTWHFPPQPHANRGRAKRLDKTEWALMGFRLAADGHNAQVDDSTLTFEQQLKAAQNNHLAERQFVVRSPKQIYLGVDDKGKYQLHWQPGQADGVIGYDIYESRLPQAHIMAGFYQKHYEKIASVDADQRSMPVTLPSSGSSYKVVTRTAGQTSLPTTVASQRNASIVNVPGKLDMRHVHELHNMHLSHRPATADRPELFYLSKFHPGYTQPIATASFNLLVEKPGWYQVNYRGRSMVEGEFFKIWSKNTVLASVTFNSDVDDKTSQRHKIYLTQGHHELQLDFTREGFDYWDLVWIELSEVGT